MAKRENDQTFASKPDKAVAAHKFKPLRRAVKIPVWGVLGGGDPGMG